MQPILEAHQLLVWRGQKAVLQVDHLSVRPGEVLALIGPNGAGKSTLLLTLARLLRPQRGELLFQGQPITALSELAYRRKLALVLQDPLLLDISVFDNVAAGLRFRGSSSAVVHAQVNEWLERLGISALAKRRARTLSGGEAQRASLARAFALQPELLLLDEPFSALDAPTRLRLLEDLQRLLKEASATAVFVTHDLDEALLLGSRVAVMFEGRIAQIGTPEVVFNTPANPAVAQFVGAETIIPGVVVESRAGLLEIHVDGFHLQGMGDALPGRQVFLCLRPEDITLWNTAVETPSSARNRLVGQIEKLFPQGPLMRVTLDCGFPLVALITRASAAEMELVPGRCVTATFKASAGHVIPR